SGNRAVPFRISSQDERAIRLDIAPGTHLELLIDRSEQHQSTGQRLTIFEDDLSPDWGSLPGPAAGSRGQNESQEHNSPRLLKALGGAVHGHDLDSKKSPCLQTASHTLR